MTTLTDMTARNPLKSVRECGFNCVEPAQEAFTQKCNHTQENKREEEEKKKQVNAKLQQANK